MKESLNFPSLTIWSIVTNMGIFFSLAHRTSHCGYSKVTEEDKGLGKRFFM